MLEHNKLFYFHFIMSIFLAANSFSHRGLTFFVFFIVTESSLTLSLCRCREYEKLSRAQLCYIGSSWCILFL